MTLAAPAVIEALSFEAILADTKARIVAVQGHDLVALPI